MTSQEIDNQFTKQLLDQANKIPENPFDKLNIFSRMLFFWVNPLLKVNQFKTQLIQKASKSNLTQEDIFNLRKKDSCEFNFQKFNEVYEEIKDDPKISNKIRATFFRVYKYEIIVVVILYFFTVSSNITNLYSVQVLLKAFSDPNRGKDFMLMVPGLTLQLITYIFMSIIKSNYNFNYVIQIFIFLIKYQQYSFKMKSLLTVRMSGALSMKIFQKTMQYPLQRNQFYKLGDILNMVQVDILQIVSYIQNIFMIIFIFPCLVFSIYICYSSVQNFQIILIMFACVFVFFIISIIFGGIYGSLQKSFMHQKDLRMRSLEEMMRGIKTIKYNGLEQFFDGRIKNQREKEIKKLRQQNFLTCVNNFIQNISSTIYILIITDAYGIQSLGEFINISNAYTSTLGYVTILPFCIQGVVVGMNSMKRLDHFLLEGFVYQPQLVQPQVSEGNQKNQQYSIIIYDATFSWKNSINVEEMKDSVKISQHERLSLKQKQEDIFKIKNLHLKIKKGEFVVFYGDLGSGKSSILQGILGEMEVEGGEYVFKHMVRINGDISLSTQEPWIIQDTVKENIIFGQEYESSRYKQSLQACCLEEDIAYFVDGDQTNIGEKGDTLSGGQRKRLNLARAIYKDADIYFLDDPLSALDIGVANHISRECFNGFLKNKTRIIFTNNLIGMQNADRIFIVKKGEIVNEGKYQTIKKIISGEYDCEQEKLEEEKEQNQSERIFKSNQQQKSIKNESVYTKKLIKQEDIQQGAIKLDVFKEFIKNIGGIFTIIAITLILAAFILSQLYAKLLVTNVKPGSTEEDQFQIMILYCICDGSRVVAIFLYESFFVFKMISLSRFLHKTIAYGLLRASFTKFYNLITTGRLMNRLSKDIYEIDVLIPKDLALIVNNVGYVIVSAITCGLMCNLKVIPIIFVYLFLSIFLTVFFLKAKRQAVRIEATSKSPILQYFSEIIRGVFYLRNCVEHQKIKETFKQSVDIDLRNQIAINGIQYWYECITSFISVFPIVISCTITFYDLSTDPNTALLMAVVVANVSMLGFNMKLTQLILKDAINQISNIFQVVVQNKLMNIVHEDYEILSLNNFTKNSSSQSGEYYNDVESNRNIFNERKNTQSKNVNPQSIVFKNASFQYREDLPNCLQDLNLRIQGNEKVGVVGRTGAGKTSITLALTRIIDLVQGDVIINGKKLRNTISVVSQEPYIFEGTLKQNLDPYGQYTNEDIIKVYSRCGFSSCNSFKLGLDTDIQQLGDNLSEGEKQLISIARIILRKSNIVIVDEPTSHIDAALEEHVTKLLNESFKDCLMITIAHKIKTIMSSDKILVLDHGKVQEFDHPEKLLSNENSLFSGIINMINQGIN